MQADAHPLGQPMRLPGDSGVWAFIIADMGAFAMFFLIFTAGRIAAPELYEQSRQTLNIELGVLNTLILLTSSLFMARAVEAARKAVSLTPLPQAGGASPNAGGGASHLALLFDNSSSTPTPDPSRMREGGRRAITLNLILAIVTGLGFAVTKLIEYKAKGAAGIGLTTNEFYTYYFAFTGIHFLHFAIGIGALLMMLAKARRDPLDAKFQTWIESVGCYWHMVDLLWIMLFPMIYLQKAG